MSEFLYKDESYLIRGACFEVYKEKGNGFLEPVYQECLEKELALQGIPFKAQAPFKTVLQRRSAKTKLHSRLHLLRKNYSGN